MLVVGRHIAQQRDLQLSSTSEQHPVQQLTTDRADPPLGEGVRWRSRIGVRRIRMPS